MCFYYVGRALINGLMLLRKVLVERVPPLLLCDNTTFLLSSEWNNKRPSWNQRQSLLAFWSWLSILQNSKIINVSCLWITESVVLCYNSTNRYPPIMPLVGVSNKLVESGDGINPTKALSVLNFEPKRLSSSLEMKQWDVRCRNS